MPSIVASGTPEIKPAWALSVHAQKTAWEVSIFANPTRRVHGVPQRGFRTKPARRAEMKLNTYLSFDGHCREAFAFYAQALGGKITAMMKIGRAVQQECRDRSRMPSSA
eukprot:TRINITY_DN18229_c0_g1_i2.p2 TRINITY_DN18229_c0_g1~~TRINITY_DN18229_c0_g1_i2.p2  ORF type:complete len:109 (+),score=20.98 TRINITY_DN18229_c0_g1_i2:65-391(+)